MATFLPYLDNASLGDKVQVIVNKDSGANYQVNKKSRTYGTSDLSIYPLPNPLPNHMTNGSGFSRERIWERIWDPSDWLRRNPLPNPLPLNQCEAQNIKFLTFDSNSTSDESDVLKSITTFSRHYNHSN